LPVFQNIGVGYGRASPWWRLPLDGAAPRKGDVRPDRTARHHFRVLQPVTGIR